jgi:hypothetical protein
MRLWSKPLNGSCNGVFFAEKYSLVAGRIFAVLLVFLRGVLGNRCGWRWFFDGEIVVRVWQNVES